MQQNRKVKNEDGGEVAETNDGCGTFTSDKAENKIQRSVSAEGT